MTEKEAKTKWCHRSDRCWGNIHTPEDEVPNGIRCIGSACMAWRWETDFNDMVARQPGKSVAEYRALADGYCGLAGKP